MKTILIGALVGGIIIFIWQFLSFALINFHQPAQRYTDKQDAILNSLADQQLEEGGYLLPNLPSDATMDDHQALMDKSLGKPWASIQYHKSLENNMVMNMVRGLLVNIIIVFLLGWILSKMNTHDFRTIVLSSLFVGLIVFLNAHYTNFIWYQTFDIWAHLADAIVSWGLTGLWLAWWFNRKNTRLASEKINV